MKKKDWGKEFDDLLDKWGFIPTPLRGAKKHNKEMRKSFKSFIRNLLFEAIAEAHDEGYRKAEKKARQEGIEEAIELMEEIKIPKQEKLKEMSEKSERLRQAYERNKDSKQALEAVKYDENSQAVNVLWGRTEGFVIAIDKIISELKKNLKK